MGVCVASNQAMNTARVGVRAAAEDDHHDMMLLISTASELFWVAYKTSSVSSCDAQRSI